MADIIFDFDGTIADSLEVISEIFLNLNGKTRKLNRTEVAEFRGLPVLTIAHRAGIPAWQMPFLLAKGRRQMAKHVAELQLFAGIKPLVKDLHAAGHHLFIMSSNSSPNIRRFLRSHRLSGYFGHVYGGVGLLNKAKALRLLIKRNRLRRENCFYIGDEGRDIEAAKEAGIRPIAVAWGFAHVKTLEELEPFGLAETPAEISDVINQSE